MFAPSARWREWIDERLAGSTGRPPRTPIGTDTHGGRAVVTPTSPSELPLCWAISRTDGSWHIRPWQGPIVTVV